MWIVDGMHVWMRWHIAYSQRLRCGWTILEKIQLWHRLIVLRNFISMRVKHQPNVWFKCCHFPFVFRIKSKIIGHETHGAGTQIFLCTQLRNKSYQLTIYISFFFFNSSFWYIFCSIEAKKKNACTRTRICMLLNIMVV